MLRRIFASVVAALALAMPALAQQTGGMGPAPALSAAQVTAALGYTPANIAGDTFTGDVRIPHLMLGGVLAGNSTLSVNGYGYIGDPEAQDPTWLGGANIASITKANPGVVTTSTAHTLSTGNIVKFTMPSGMTELDGVKATITVLSSTTYSIGINTSAYSTYTDYATNHGRAAPCCTNLAEVAGLTIRADTAGGGGIMLRNRRYDGLMYIGIGNDIGDLEGWIQLNGSGNSSLGGSRSLNFASGGGPIDFWTSMQGTPLRALHIDGNNGSNEGFVGINTATPAYRLDVNGTGRFVGALLAPTASAVTNTTQVATTAYADRLVRAWAMITYSGATPTLIASYNVGSISVIGTGKVGVNFSAPFTSTSTYGCVTSAANSATNNGNTVPVLISGNQAQAWHYETAALTDPASVHVLCFGS